MYQHFSQVYRIIESLQFIYGFWFSGASPRDVESPVKNVPGRLRGPRTEKRFKRGLGWIKSHSTLLHTKTFSNCAPKRSSLKSTAVELKLLKNVDKTQRSDTAEITFSPITGTTGVVVIVI